MQVWDAVYHYTVVDARSDNILDSESEPLKMGYSHNGLQHSCKVVCSGGDLGGVTFQTVEVVQLRLSFLSQYQFNKPLSKP
ncbi:hypothetical protein ALC56_02603 [Trachymyrmex septentrionalis]|uniref:Uncharacterized protein n=1 Tax=Trachymyrmex septentrionalis TaxID=34720 RepID=A0A195FQU5_9HYME|nr:hypothetical protein ALC56_02603 [Trachymyrmex septentrionalis]